MRNISAKNKKRIVAAIICTLLLVLAIVAAVLLTDKGGSFGAPTLTIETPQKIDLSQTEEVTLDMNISHLGEALYPAASMSIRFDPSKLEFLGLEEGNLFVLDQAGNEFGRILPEWSVNPQQSNKNGCINIMYLDMTGGKHSFNQNLLAEEDNVVLRLNFRLRGSVRPGDVLDLVLEDAVFAASDESQSLAMTTNTLRAKNGKIVVGG